MDLLSLAQQKTHLKRTAGTHGGEGGVMKDIKDVLKEVGYDVLDGAESVLNAISFDFSGDVLCSGYGVFPDGNKCQGCSDCRKD